jgi:hypothetical protein
VRVPSAEVGDDVGLDTDRHGDTSAGDMLNLDGDFTPGGRKVANEARPADITDLH